MTWGLCAGHTGHKKKGLTHVELPPGFGFGFVSLFFFFSNFHLAVNWF